MAKVNYSVGEAGERPWGCWRILETGENYCVKRIEVDPGHRLSLQYHHHRAEDWIIVAGQGIVECDERSLIVTAGDSVRIPLKAKHRMSNPGIAPLVVIEVQHGNHLDENDIVRLEDDYDRS